MIQPIGTRPAQGASLGAADALADGPLGQAAAALSTLSVRVAQTIAGALGLAERSAGAPAGGRGDFYGIDALAGELAAALGASPAEAGRLTRALHDYAGEVAALLAARPHSSALARISDLQVDPQDDNGRRDYSPADRAIGAIEGALLRLREDAPWTSGR
jgi:hypothetical protein